MSRSRSMLLGALACAVAAGATTAALAGSASSAATKSIKVGDNYFVRPSGVPVVTVSAKTRVTWHWVGSGHDVKVLSGPIKFSSKVLSKGATYSRIMTRRGTYKLYCEVHGAKDQSMILRVK
jgi:plastocyanin